MASSSSSSSSSYRVLVDTREQLPWVFPPHLPCLGSRPATLKTGDYTLEGYESQFVIERKRSTGEIAQNLTQKRFENELRRLEQFQFPFLVCEFTLEDIVRFPLGSGIPRSRWRSLRITPQFLMRRLNEIELQYKTKIVFAGKFGREFASSLFKRVVEART